MAAFERSLETLDAAVEGAGTGQSGPRVWRWRVRFKTNCRTQEDEVWDLASTVAQDIYTRRPDVQIFPFARSEFFEELRISLTYIVGQVQRWGLTVSGDHLPIMPQDNPPESGKSSPQQWGQGLLDVCPVRTGNRHQGCLGSGPRGL